MRNFYYRKKIQLDREWFEKYSGLTNISLCHVKISILLLIRLSYRSGSRNRTCTSNSGERTNRTTVEITVFNQNKNCYIYKTKSGRKERKLHSQFIFLSILSYKSVLKYIILAFRANDSPSLPAKSSVTKPRRLDFLPNNSILRHVDPIKFLNAFSFAVPELKNFLRPSFIKP